MTENKENEQAEIAAENEEINKSLESDKSSEQKSRKKSRDKDIENFYQTIEEKELFNLAYSVGIILGMVNKELPENEINDLIKDVSELSDPSLHSLRDLFATKNYDLDLNVTNSKNSFKAPFLVNFKKFGFMPVVDENADNYLFITKDGITHNVKKNKLQKIIEEHEVLQFDALPPKEVEDVVDGVIQNASMNATNDVDAGKPLPIDQNKENLAKAKEVNKYLTKQIWKKSNKQVFAAIFAAALSNLFLLVTPIFMIIVYDRVVPHLALSTMWALAIGAFIAFSADFYARYIRAKIQDSIATNLANEIVIKLFNKGMRMPFSSASFYMKRLSYSSRELVSNINALSLIIVCVMIDIPFFVLILIYIASFAKFVVLAPLLIVAVIHCIYLWISKVKNNDDQKLNAWNGSKFKILEIVPNIIHSIISLNASRLMMGRFEKSLDKSSLLEHEQRMRTQILSFAGMVMAQSAIIVGMIIAIYQITYNLMSAAALAGIALLIGRLASLLTPFYNALMRLKIHTNSMANIFDLIREKELKNAKDPIHVDLTETKKITVNNISYTYLGEEKEVLNNISFQIEKNDELAIVGPSASGKSTLIEVIAGLLQIKEGEILFDGKPYSHYDILEMKKAFGYAAQNPSFIGDTIIANIQFGIKDLDKDYLIKVLEILEVEKFLHKKSKGLGTVIVPNARNISQAEKQIISLARVLIRKPNYLLLDDPLSSLDDVTSKRILDKIINLYKDKTIIISSPNAVRLLGMKNMLVLNNGFNVAFGKTNDVVEKLRAANKNNQNSKEKNDKAIEQRKTVNK